MRAYTRRMMLLVSICGLAFAAALWAKGAFEDMVKKANEYREKHPAEGQILNRCIGFVASVHADAAKPLARDKTGGDIYQWCIRQLKEYEGVTFTDVIIVLRMPAGQMEAPYSEGTIQRWDDAIPAARITPEYKCLTDSGLIQKAHERHWTTYHIQWKGLFKGSPECSFRGYFLAKPRNETSVHNEGKSPVIGFVTMNFSLIREQWFTQSVVVAVGGHEVAKMELKSSEQSVPDKR